MLVLTRRVGEKLVIGDNIVVTNLSANGNQVQLGVEAPKDIPVRREEIYKSILDEKKTTKKEDEA